MTIILDKFYFDVTIIIIIVIGKVSVEIEGAIKGKRCDQLSLDLLDQLDSVAREIWERMIKLFIQ